MDFTHIAFAFFVGALIGAVVTWIIASGRKSTLEHGAATDRQSVLLLNQRMQDRDAEVRNLQVSLQTRADELSRVKDDMTRTLVELSAAKERSSHLHEFQLMLEAKESQVMEGKDKIAVLERESAELRVHLQEERKAATDKLAVLNEASQKMQEMFKALSDSALNKNTESFMNVAKNILERYQEGARVDLDHRQKSIDLLVKPLTESLKLVDQKMIDMEKARTSAYDLLTDQVGKLADTQNKLQQALRAPATRGRWGEVQLRRVVEMAGMVQHCDFIEQETVDAGEKKLRPDMVILLPEGKTVIVDSKVPLQAFLEAIDAPDDTLKRKFIEEHVRQLRAHIIKLSQKSYWEQFPQSPEFVVLFLPNDAFFIAAAEQDSAIMEDAIKNKVLIATPMTLVALLQTVSYAWRQQSIAENAAEIKDLGKQLYDRVRTLAGHFDDVRRGLDSTVKSYNRAVGALERRVLPAARKFKELGAADGPEIEAAETTESIPIEFHLRELIGSVKADDEPKVVTVTREISIIQDLNASQPSR